MDVHDVGGPLSSIADPNNNNLPPQSQVQVVNLAGSGGSTGPDEAGDQVGIIIAEQQNEQNNDGVTRTRVTRKQLGIKRACSECRQQKLRCDVVKDPFTTCSRCRRLQLVCKIDTSFKRIEKRRAKNERRQLAEEASRTELPTTAGSPFYELAVSVDRDTIMTQTVSNVGTRSYPTVPMQSTELQQVHNSSSSQWPETPGSNHMATHPVRTQFGSNISVNSALSTAAGMTRKLDGVLLTANEVQALFQLYFRHYHPFLPFLQPSKSPDYYFNSSRLLFWTIISIASRRYISDLTLLPSLSISVPRLLWSVLQGVPQSYHDVKAICLLCTWPFPLNSSSCDPTFMLSGTMMHLAMQIGLHRPSQAQDFSKVTLKLHHDELQDRITTWITCRIVAQSVATGYGQPPTIFDGIPDHSVSRLPDNYVSSELTCRLRIEKLADRITRELYSMTDTKSTFNPSQHFVMINIVDRELTQLESELITPNPSSFLLLYLRCAHLHLHLYTFFDSIASQNFIASLLTLYKSCQALLTMVLSSNDNILSYCPNYVFQMTLASGFTLLKLLRSPMMEYIDYSECKALFNSNIAAVRKISVSNNDLPGRLAEVLAQLMARANEAAQNRLPNTKNDWGCQQLKVRGRMSMSVMFDGLWEWRNGFETDSVRGLTTSSTEISSVQVGESPAQAAHDNESASAIEANQDFDLDNMVFDDFYPVNWLIENIPEIPLSSLPDAVAA